ncbi:MAG: hypothetical protein IT423_13755 [Pirellulaceae bacterium]|nr:hypothetical protein [Pirellulaceae bacterium]
MAGRIGSSAVQAFLPDAARAILLSVCDVTDDVQWIVAVTEPRLKFSFTHARTDTGLVIG